VVKQRAAGLEVDEQVTSLVGSAVPLTTEPKTRTFDAPWLAATRAISAFRARSKATVGGVKSAAAVCQVPTTITVCRGSRPA